MNLQRDKVRENPRLMLPVENLKPTCKVAETCSNTRLALRHFSTTQNGEHLASALLSIAFFSQ